MRSQPAHLLQTLPHPCGYFEGRLARNLVLDPADPALPRHYALALRHGFRRAGGHIYRPYCGSCRACVPCRVPVREFMPDRSQRRCLRDNADLEIIDTDPGFTRERYALYRRYLRTRHAGGGMDEAAAQDFREFLSAPWSPTRFLEFRHQGNLLAVAVTDISPAGLSAVYTFFDPAEAHRGLGTRAILEQIEWARRLDVPHVYLGFWIAGHPKMHYKARFRPLQILEGDRWVARQADGRNQAP
ncbi:MAG TPA: arginyltransferase [Rhodanobacteraceae bacterium]|nr:arginyltransferase [Rhodanobacteraceae bacterium]